MKSVNIQRVRPPALRAGDTVGIVAPASNVHPDDLQAGCNALQRAGYRPFYFDSILEKDLYFAGSVERRVHELNDMFARDDVRAILCARGGYGANYLLPKLDIKQIKSHPKIFVGYSDITCLLTRFLDAAGLITFHGPMVAKDWSHADGVDSISWQALAGTAEWHVPLSDDVRGLVDGEAEGELYGGCLSILVASLGTPYEIRTEGTILFLEDVATKPYQIDRLLMQLKLAGKFAGVRAIVFGQMLDCVQTANQGYTLEEVVTRVVGDLRIPVAFGVRSGHVTGGNITLPFGVQASLAIHAGRVAMKILGPAVTL
ncbi:MAG TPA: LD-carboxypeptidase [Verrucomicrobiae bacterium]|jgi:muramoyltetrapeptide carboxypeptidase|nr:LD-carboxypeptidase [Verrucomicrobiae bacterium]